MRDHRQDHDVMKVLNVPVRWFCDDPAELEGWDLGLRLLESPTFTEGPAEVLALLPPDMVAMLPDLADNPEVNSYRQNLFEVGGDDPSAG